MARKKPDHRATPKTRRTTVPATYRGFSLQATRFLYYLLKSSPADTISLEYIEDVAVETSGETLVEEDKSYRSRNPLSDRSTAFWKTLRNWVEAVASGTLAADNTRFIFYAPGANMGTLITGFHNSKTLEDSTAAVNKAIETLRSEDGWNIAKDTIPHVRIALETTPEIAAAVVTHFTVDLGTDDPDQMLGPLLLGKLVADDAYDSVVTWAHGWVKCVIDRFLNQRQPPRVLQDEFHSALLNYVRTHDRQDILTSFAGRPSEKRVEEELAVRDYVSQLRIIELDDIDILQAVSDFLGASADRTAWAERGLISPKSIETLEAELSTTWRNKRRRTFIALADKPKSAQGAVLYSDCIEHAARVDKLETPRQFIRGSWHVLSDDHRVGWHPDYELKLASVRPAIEKETKEDES